MTIDHQIAYTIRDVIIRSIKMLAEEFILRKNDDSEIESPMDYESANLKEYDLIENDTEVAVAISNYPLSVLRLLNYFSFFNVVICILF